MTSPGDATVTTRYRVSVGPRVLDVVVVESERGLEVRIDQGASVSAAVRRPRGDALRSLLIGGHAFSALVEGREGAYSVVLDGLAVDVLVQDERAARLASAALAGRPSIAENAVNAPMPGLVLAVNVEPGQQVTKGASLVVLQAMKMENELTSPRDGRVSAIHVEEAQTVEQGFVLVTLEGE